MIVHLLLLTASILHARTATASSISNIPSIFNLTSSDEPSLPSNRVSAEGDFWKCYCTPSQQWNQPPMQQDDCQGVLEYFYYETMTDGGRKPMEFMSPGAKKTRHMKGQTTPRKYTFGELPRDIQLHPISDLPQSQLLPLQSQVNIQCTRDPPARLISMI